MNKFELGMRLIGYGHHNLKGTIVEFKKHNRGELNIIIEWENNDLMNTGIDDNSNHLVQYTESMLWECFSINKIGIDKEYYRDLLLKNLLKK
jgi:hypothetical protein